MDKFELMEKESFIGRLCGPDAQAEMYQLCSYLGWQKGALIGTEEFRAILQERGWFYYRPMSLILGCPINHPNVASIVYSIAKNVRWHSGLSERFLDEGMGFWKSSVSVNSIHVFNGFKATSQERMAFKDFTFVLS